MRRIIIGFLMLIAIRVEAQFPSPQMFHDWQAVAGSRAVAGSVDPLPQWANVKLFWKMSSSALTNDSGPGGNAHPWNNAGGVVASNGAAYFSGTTYGTGGDCYTNCGVISNHNWAVSWWEYMPAPTAYGYRFDGGYTWGSTYSTGWEAEKRTATYAFTIANRAGVIWTGTTNAGWHQIVAASTKAVPGYQIYYDGTHVGTNGNLGTSDAWSHNFGTAGQIFSLGRSPDGYNYFIGFLDDVVVWDFADGTSFFTAQDATNYFSLYPRTTD